MLQDCQNRVVRKKHTDNATGLSKLGGEEETHRQCYRTVKTEWSRRELTRGPGRNSGPATHRTEQSLHTILVVQHLQNISPQNLNKTFVSHHHITPLHNCSSHQKPPQNIYTTPTLHHNTSSHIIIPLYHTTSLHFHHTTSLHFSHTTPLHFNHIVTYHHNTSSCHCITPLHHTSSHHIIIPLYHITPLHFNHTTSLHIITPLYHTTSLHLHRTTSIQANHTTSSHHFVSSQYTTSSHP